MFARRKWAVGLVAVGVVVGVLVVVFPREREPEYGGKRLSEWVEAMAAKVRKNDSRRQLDPPDPAAEAIRHIGPKAVPYLLRWIRCIDVPTWKRKLYRATAEFLPKAQVTWKAKLYRDSYAPSEATLLRAEGVMFAFDILGPRAKEAIPDLWRIMDDPEGGHNAWCAAACLTQLGNDAIPALVAGMTNRSDPVRLVVCRELAERGTNALPAAAGFLQLLNDPDRLLRTSATNFFRKIGAGAPERATR